MNLQQKKVGLYHAFKLLHYKKFRFSLPQQLWDINCGWKDTFLH